MGTKRKVPAADDPAQVPTATEPPKAKAKAK